MKLVISGSTPSQKNKKTISLSKATGRPFLRTDPKVKEWQEKACLELKMQFKDYKVTNYPISATLIFFYADNRKHDLDNSASTVMDSLVNSGVIEDDNIHFIDCLTLQYGGVDKANPRAEIYLDD